MRLLLGLALILLACHSQAEIPGLSGGHAKAQYLLGSYPDDSLLRDAIGSPSHDLNGELRLKLGGRRSNWSWQADYQLLALYGDSLELGSKLPADLLIPGGVPDDDRRLMDLTHVFSQQDRRAVLHRLDRLQLGYTGEHAVLKLGRQAVSWGNGLLYNPVDFFNPFDPAAVDKEYKSGDDMLYGQYLWDSGNDLQLVSVWRRDDEGHSDSAVNSDALKYHAFIAERELDLLLARHFEDTIAAVGGITDIGAAILRGDILHTRTDHDNYTSLVVNFSYSWVWAGHNVSAILEYFYNDLGLRESDYGTLAQREDLLSRLQRGELYTLGRHYLGTAITIEITPLLNIMPNVFLNLGDSSGLLQVTGQYDVRQDWQILLAVNLPFGGDGTEYGGLDSPVEGRQLSSGPGIFAQLGFYF